MSSFTEYLQEVLEFFDVTAKCADDMDQESIGSNIRAVAEELKKRELKIVVCGEMKKGKSSLLEQFLEEKDLFPVDVNIATNAITIVKYAEHEKIEVILEHRKGEAIEYETKQIERSQIREYVTEDENENNRKRVNGLLINIPNGKLKEGFVFVDTPGLGSLNFQHAQITRGFLPSADILLFVSDALNPLTESELNFLASAWQHCQTIVFVLTKTDKKTHEEIDTIITDNRSKIAGILKIDQAGVKIIPVSNKEKARWQATGEEEYLTNSNFRLLEDVIWSTIYDNRASILVEPSLQAFQGELAKLRGIKHLEAQSLLGDIEKTKALRAKLEEKSAEQKRLLERGADWKEELRHAMGQTSTELSGEIQDTQSVLGEHLSKMLAHKTDEESLKQVSFSVNSTLSQLVYKVKDEIMRHVQQVNEQIRVDLGLQLGLEEVLLEKVAFQEKATIEYTRSRKDYANRVVRGTKNAMFSSTIGATTVGVLGALVGGLVGFLVGGPVGAYAAGAAGWSALAGAATGMTMSIRDSVIDLRHKDLPNIRNAYNSYINRSINSIKTTLATSTREITKILIADLSAQLRERASLLDKVIREMDTNVRLNVKDIPEKQTRIKIQRQLIEKMTTEGEELAARIAPAASNQ